MLDVIRFAEFRFVSFSEYMKITVYTTLLTVWQQKIVLLCLACAYVFGQYPRNKTINEMNWGQMRNTQKKNKTHQTAPTMIEWLEAERIRSRYVYVVHIKYTILLQFRDVSMLAHHFHIH